MGTDIHAHVEVKVGGKWLHFNAPHVDRDYRLFTKLAGVRDVEDVEPIAQPRGLPDDVSDVTRILYERERRKSHSESFITRGEIELLSDWYIKHRPKEHHGLEGVFGYIDGNPLHALGGGSEPELFEDVRIVFWFDC